MRKQQVKPGGGKGFGAVKAVLLRLVKDGYRPEWTQITVSTSDRQRLRDWCAAHGNVSLVEGFHAILDKVRAPKSTDICKTSGKLSDLVSSIVGASGEYDKVKLCERIRKGEFDDYIRIWSSR